LFLISISFDLYFSWNFWSPGGPPFDRINLNSFEIHLNNSQSPLFIWARPASCFSPGRPTRARALLLSPSPADTRSRMSVPHRAAPPSRTQSLTSGPIFRFGPPVSRVDPTPSRSPVVRQCLRPRPPAGCHCWLLEPFPRRARAPSFSPVPPAMRRPLLDPLPPVFRSAASPRAPSKAAGHRPRPPSPHFSSPSAPRAAASQLPH
jgi:hypothetical protein